MKLEQASDSQSICGSVCWSTEEQLGKGCPIHALFSDEIFENSDFNGRNSKCPVPTVDHLKVVKGMTNNL